MCSRHDQLDQHLRFVNDLIHVQCQDLMPSVNDNVTPPSYSLMYALQDGFSLVLFSLTHLFPPGKYFVHNSMGVRLILAAGMLLFWNGNLLHCGGKSRKNGKGWHLYDMRLFSYLWQNSQFGLRSDGAQEHSTNVHHVDKQICPHFDRPNLRCSECSHTTQREIDLSLIDLANFNVGDTILGNINEIGWCVVKGEPLVPAVDEDFEVISEFNKLEWFPIDHTERVMKYNSTFDKNEFMLAAGSHTQNFFASLKSSVLDKYLPTKDYIFGKTNLLMNRDVVENDQWPHTDFPHRLL